MTSMKPTRWISALILALALMTAPALSVTASAEAGGTQRCGNLTKNGFTMAKRITAKNISCRRAKQKIYDNFLPAMDMDGYTCRGYPRQTCTKRAIVIAFTYP